MDTDGAWERIAQTNPFWGVISSPSYLGNSLDGAALAEFLQSGEDHVRHVLDVLRTRLDARAAPTDVLDFGCGVGRLAIPFAATARHVTGVDAAPTMLARAAQIAETVGANNISFASPDSLASSRARFDLIHSVLVFQHIPPARGFALLEVLLDALKPRGFGALQFHINGRAGRAAALARSVRHRSAIANRAIVTLRRRDARDALISMYPYSLTQVMSVLARHGIGETFAELNPGEHGYLDATVYFRKQ